MMATPAQFVLIAIGAPAVLLAVLGCAALLGGRLHESLTIRLTAAAMTVSFVAMSAALVSGAAGTGQRLLS